MKDKLFAEKKITVAVLRLDALHPVVSGNKFFKLKYFLEEALNKNKAVITFGGAYSNHLVATAFACREAGIACTGIVRGEAPEMLSPTLQQCREYGMQLKFISRDAYKKHDEPSFLHELEKDFVSHIVIPEGGYHPLGAKGSAGIGEYIRAENYSHIACAVGTATTIAGLLSVADAHQTVLGFNVLKGMTDLDLRLRYLLAEKNAAKKIKVIDDYTFDGYAKKNAALIAFMNRLYEQENLPTDFVYTAKMMYGIYDMVRMDHFAPGSKIVCIHTGGLQGNASLPEGSLIF
ncbi:MAG: pyridoxal-phosphate dependent enzyme [Ferruginibacter sp.]